VEGRLFQYDHFLSDLMITVVDVRFEQISTVETSVSLAFTRTALAPQSNPEVRAANEADKTAGKFFQQAIDSYLKIGRPAKQP
jgi:hypothetical protein